MGPEFHRGASARRGLTQAERRLKVSSAFIPAFIEKMNNSDIGVFLGMDNIAQMSPILCGH